MYKFSNCNGIVYTVQPGDTVYAISQRFFVPVPVILSANPGIEVTNLPIGYRMCIPAKCRCNRKMMDTQTGYYY